MTIESRPAVDRIRYERMTPSELRAAFLVEGLFTPGAIRLVHWESERTLVGSAVPGASPLRLEAPEAIHSPHFLERRELGVVNVGGPGSVSLDGQRFEMAPRDVLYAGRGTKDVVFENAAAANPALFWLVSHPAHATHPSRRVPPAEAETARIGDAEHASARVLRRHIHARGATSCQLVMGVTDLETGSVWNTIPPHTHTRRTEIYLYFDLSPADAVVHVMGPPDATRCMIVRNLQAVLSPPWSMHFGAGTSRYAFVWSMGGENQEFEDMQGVPVDALG
ncbi:MAG TPA: 5-dehydro-4-deoxy-D-glucuronate isomerase [Thermoanaerobaculia bacterium]|jgi:4-deoxy-L-threo-5-hexosulose-uronate ketol-isomerase